MLVFWVAVAALSLAAAAMMVAGAARAARGDGEADPTLDLYRRQMGELDDLADRGLLSEAELRAARAEAGRRILTAAERDVPLERAGKPSLRAAIAAVVGVPVAALTLYFGIGAPGLPDQPFAGRLAQWRASNPAQLDPARRAAVLQQIVRERPDDVDGLRFLARDQLASNNPFEAEMNIKRAITLAPQRADLWLLLGEALVSANEGAVTPGATRAFEEALKRDPGNVPARYFIGRGRIEAGAAPEGIATWRALLADLPAEAPEREPLAQELAEVERTGALPPPNAMAGESVEMQAAVRGMVEGLAARLAADPDNPEGWVRLVRAYTVLGDTARRDEALATARARYAARPDVLSALTQAVEAP
jgi:cytochrome c-type biogenesis protein CcmH